MMELESCDTCTKPTDNRKFNCPPRMSDGRHFTDYRSRCALNTRASFNILDNEKSGMKIFKTPPSTSYDFRQFLIHNGEKIMEMNREEAFQRNMCGPCTLDPSTMLPEQTKISCDESSCKVELNNSTGLGQGRHYNTIHSQPKSVFDERRQENQPKSCCSSLFDDAQFYPLDGKVDSDYGRLTFPTGGKPLQASDRLK